MFVSMSKILDEMLKNIHELILTAREVDKGASVFDRDRVEVDMIALDRLRRALRPFDGVIDKEGGEKT